MIDRDNVFRLIDAAQPDMQTALALTRFVGLQVREIVGLRWDDINPEELIATITRRSLSRCLSRSCRPITTRRIVPLHMDAVAVLNDEMERQLNSRVTQFVVSQRLRVVALRNGLTDAEWDREVMDVARRADITIDERPLSAMRESLRREWETIFGAHAADAWMGYASDDVAHDPISDEMLATASQLTFDEFAAQG